MTALSVPSPVATVSHALSQRETVAAARSVLADMLMLDQDDESVPVAPAEGWVSWSAAHPDALGTARAWHDASAATIRAHREQLAAQVRRQLDEEPEEGEIVEKNVWQRLTSGAPLHEQFTVADGAMTVNVVNIVHTSYCSPPASASVGATAGTVLTHNWMWRRLMHLGCQMNHVHTSIKVCYAPPFNATHLIFQTARVLETGAASMTIARVMFDATLAFVRLAGAHDLQLRRRVPQNVVATSRMPDRHGLCLNHLQWRNAFVSYTPSKFAGAVIKHPELFDKPHKKIMMLGFSGGAVVCVGGKSLEEIRHAYAFMHPVFMESIDTPENLAFDRNLSST